MFITHSNKKLACLIITLPFYAHTKEQAVQSEKQPQSYNCTVLLILTS